MVHTGKYVLPPRIHRWEDDNQALTDQQLHIWEHATLLYHSYEWQEAADLFENLSRDIPSPQLRSFCLLNAGMMMARMGEYSMGASFCHTAAQDDPNSIIAVFLMAIMAYELEDYPNADSCFVICLKAIGEDGAVDYSKFGLYFALDRETVRSNIREVRGVQHRGGIASNSISTIPAELTFEAPRRFNANPRISRDDRRRSEARRNLANMFTTGSPSLESTQPDEDRALSPITLWPRQSCIPAALHPARRPAQRAPTNDTSKVRKPPSAEIGPQNGRQSWPWRGRPKTPYTPRDARARGASCNTDELATFIKKAPPVRHMIPRDPKGEYESVQELSTFAQAYAPDIVRHKKPKPFILDPTLVAEVRRAATLPSQYDSGRQLNPSKDSPGLHRSVTQPLNARPSHLNHGGAAMSAAHPRVQVEEMLLPVRYRPPDSNASVEKQKARQRARTLDKLEDRHDTYSASNNTFPPKSRRVQVDVDGGTSRATSQHESPSPVATEDIFDVIRNRF